MMRRLLFALPLVLIAAAAYVIATSGRNNEALRFVVYRPSTAVFFIDKWTRRTERLDVDHRPETTTPFGRPGDIGLGCFQNNREDPLGLRVYANGEWHFSPRPVRPPGGDLRLGQPGDVPFCADFDGDGHPDNGVFSAGQWLVHTSTDHDLRFTFGVAGDRPVLLNVPGRGNRNDRQNLVYGVYRAGIWYIDVDGDGQADAMHAFGGQPQDIPLLVPRLATGGTAAYSLAIFRDGTWFVKPDPSGSEVTQFYFGTAGDIPSILY